MTAIQAALAGGVISASVSFVLAGLIAWAGPVDPPETGSGARTSHVQPTPTSGGLAILAGAAIGALIFALLRAAIDAGSLRGLAVTLALAGGLGLLGAFDDLFDLGARAKLLIHAAAALAFALWVARIDVLPLGLGVDAQLGPVVGALGAALWIVVVTNAMNFMDGANGVAPGAASLVLASFALAAAWGGAPILAGAALVGAMAGAGFLPWNLGGKLFQGDTGSVFSGFLFAGLTLIAAGRDGHGPVFLYFGPLAFLPFLTDVLLTLLIRARRGQPLLQAHREHLYQLWLRRTGKPHLALAWRTWAVMGLSGGAALAVQQAPSRLQPLLFALSVVVSAAGWAVCRSRLERT